MNDQRLERGWPGHWLHSRSHALQILEPPNTTICSARNRAEPGSFQAVKGEAKFTLGCKIWKECKSLILFIMNHHYLISLSNRWSLVVMNVCPTAITIFKKASNIAINKQVNNLKVLYITKVTNFTDLPRCQTAPFNSSIALKNVYSHGSKRYSIKYFYVLLRI